MRSIVFALAASCLLASSAHAQEMRMCMTKYHTGALMEGEAPGTLATGRDTPCRVPRYGIGAGNGRRAPEKLGPILVIEPPRHGRVSVQGRSGFTYAPAPGYTGSDTMLIRFMHYRTQPGGYVRFAVSVN